MAFESGLSGNQREQHQAGDQRDYDERRQRAPRRRTRGAVVLVVGVGQPGSRQSDSGSPAAGAIGKPGAIRSRRRNRNPIVIPPGSRPPCRSPAPFLVLLLIRTVSAGATPRGRVPEGVGFSRTLRAAVQPLCDAMRRLFSRRQIFDFK